MKRFLLMGLATCLILSSLAGCTITAEKTDLNNEESSVSSSKDFEDVSEEEKPSKPSSSAPSINVAEYLRDGERQGFPDGYTYAQDGTWNNFMLTFAYDDSIFTVADDESNTNRTVIALAEQEDLCFVAVADMNINAQNLSELDPLEGEEAEEMFVYYAETVSGAMLGLDLTTDDRDFFDIKVYDADLRSTGMRGFAVIDFAGNSSIDAATITMEMFGDDSKAYTMMSIAGRNTSQEALTAMKQILQTMHYT